MVRLGRQIGLSPTRRAVVFVAGLNVANVGVSAVTGLLIARLLGPAVRGEYAAVTSWYGLGLLVGELGLTAALVYFVAHDPEKAPAYMATARRLMLLSGLVVATIGWFVAPVLAHRSGLATAYRIMFLASPLIYVTATYTYAIQARRVRTWSMVRALQPIAYLIFTIALLSLRKFGLTYIMAALVGSSLVQLAVAARISTVLGLGAGRFDRTRIPPLLRYGITQIFATTPTTINVYLDQLVLSQAVAAAALGRYAVAVSVTTVAGPILGPIGSVLFPRFAGQHPGARSTIVAQRKALMVSAWVSGVMMLGAAAVSPWAVPFVFGPGFRGSVSMIWILCPSGVFLPCNQVMGDMLRGRNMIGRVATGQAAGALVTLPLLAALVPTLGAPGAAVTTSASYAVTSAVLVHAVLRGQSPPPLHLRKRRRHRAKSVQSS